MNAPRRGASATGSWAPHAALACALASVAGGCASAVGAGGPDAAGAAPDVAPADAPGAATDADVAPLRGFGGVQSIQHDNSTQTLAGFGLGSFAQDCAERAVGPCSVSVCPSPATGPTNGRRASAGVITLRGEQGARLEFVPAGDGSYAAQQTTPAPWHPGETITVQAPGADVPAFAVVLHFPSETAVLAPALSPPGEPSSPGLLDRSQGLRLAWSPGAVGTMSFGLGQTRPGGDPAHPTGSSVAVLCRYPMSQGAAVIPPEALSDLVPTDPQGEPSAAMEVHAIDEQRLTLGGWALSVAVVSLAPGYATFEVR